MSVGYGNMSISTTPRLTPYDNIALLRCIRSVIVDFFPIFAPIFAPQSKCVAKYWDVPPAKCCIFSHPIYTLIAICIVVVDTLAVPFTNYIVVPDTRRVRCIRRIRRNKVNKANEPWVCDIPIKIPTIAPIFAPRILEFDNIFSFFLGKFHRHEVVSCCPRIRLVRVYWFVRVAEFDKIVLVNSTPRRRTCNNRDTATKHCNSLEGFANLLKAVDNALITEEFERMSRVGKRWTQYLQFLVYRVIIYFLPHFL